MRKRIRIENADASTEATIEVILMEKNQDPSAPDSVSMTEELKFPSAMRDIIVQDNQYMIVRLKAPV